MLNLVNVNIGAFKKSFKSSALEVSYIQNFEEKIQ